jgi:hypothetical protein
MKIENSLLLFISSFNTTDNESLRPIHLCGISFRFVPQVYNSIQAKVVKKVWVLLELALVTNKA